MPILRAVWNRADGACYFCNKDTYIKATNQKKMKHNTATKEHLIPKSMGGSNRIPNIKLACHKCNKDRGVIDALMWIRIVRDPIKLDAFYRVRSLKKKLTKIARLRRRRIRYAESPYLNQLSG